MPGHPVPSLTIQIEKNTIKRDAAACRFNCRFNFQQRRGPWIGLCRYSGILISGALIADPSRQPRQGDHFAVKLDLLLLPMGVAKQVVIENVALFICEKYPIQYYVRIGHLADQRMSNGKFGRDDF